MVDVYDDVGEEWKLLSGGHKRKVHIGLERSTRATVDQVLDQRTVLILEKLKKRGILAELHGTVSTGKEANVYHGHTAQHDEIVVKIFRTSILSFKDRARYVEGEYRFRYGYSGCGNPRKMVAQWAEKEFRNLRRIAVEGLRCPTPIELRGHVIAMSFLGASGEASPRLKEADLPPSTWRRVYIECISLMRSLYHDCRLVHGDFSEYNLLFHDGRVYVIDVSQAVEHDHDHSLDFLKRDCINISNFFRRILGSSGYNEAAVVPPAQSCCQKETSTVTTEGKQSNDSSTGFTGTAVDSSTAVGAVSTTGGTGCAEEDSQEIGTESDRCCYPLPVRQLFNVIVATKAPQSCGSLQSPNWRRTSLESSSTDMSAASSIVNLFPSVADIIHPVVLTQKMQKFDDLCADMELYVHEFWNKNSKMTNATDEVDDQVFLNTWIPSNLHQIADGSFLAKELQKRNTTDVSLVLCESLVKPAEQSGPGDVKKLDGDTAVPPPQRPKSVFVKRSAEVRVDDGAAERRKLTAKSDHCDMKNGVSAAVAAVVNYSEDEDTTSHSEGEESENDDDDDDDDSGTPRRRAKKIIPSYVDGKFTGNVPEGVSRRDWKKLVKDDKRESRKHKIPKHVKKRHEKKRKQKNK